MFKVQHGISIGGKIITGSGPTAALTVSDVGTLAFQDSEAVSVGALAVTADLAVTGNTTLTGDLTVSGGDITAGNVAANLFAGNTTTNITVGSGLTTGAITLGTATSPVNIATGASTGAIVIGSSSASSQAITIGGTTTGTINIGATSGANTINIGSTASTAVNLPSAKTKVGQTTLTQGGAVAITLPATAGTLYVSGGTDVPVADGGTGTSTAPTQGGVIYGSSASAFGSSAAGTAGQILISGGTGSPTWTSNLDISLALSDSAYKKIVRVATAADLLASTFSANVLTGYDDTFTLACTTTAGSATVTTTSTAGVKVGAVISGNANIPAARTVATIVNATTFTINSGTSVTAATSITTTFTQTIAALTVDGVTLSVNDRVLVKDQQVVGGIPVSDGAKYNGIYYVSATGSTTVPWTLTRAVDADSSTDLDGAIVNVSVGTSNAGKTYKTRFPGTSTLNTTEMYWGRMVDVNSSFLANVPATARGVHLDTDSETTVFKAGTIADLAMNALGITTVQATAASTYTRASTLYIAGSPIASTNATITNPYALYVAGGATYLAGLTINSTSITSATATNMSLTTGTTGVLALDSGTTGAINIGINANAKTITIGNATGATAVNINTGTGGSKLSATTAITNAVSTNLVLDHQTSGTAATGIGVALAFDQKTSTANTERGMVLKAVTTDVTVGSEDFDFVVDLMAGGAAATEKFRISSGGNATISGGLTVTGTINAGISTFDTATANTPALKADSMVLYESLSGGGQMRIKAANATTGYGVIHRHDGANYYTLLTENNAADSGWNVLRPFSISTATGGVSLTKTTVTGGLTVSAVTTTGPSGTPSASGGTMAATTTYGKVVALDHNGFESAVSAESSGVVTTGTTASITWTWLGVSGANSYRLYVGATNAQANYFSITSNLETVSYTQTLPSASGTAKAMPTSNATGTINTAADITSGRYVNSQYVSMSHSASGATTDTVFYSSTDNYIRKNTASGFRTSLAVPGLATANTFTGILTLTPTSRSSGSAAYFTITTPADTAQTASTESIGINKTAATRQWATGALTTQREVVLGAPTYSFVGASTLTNATNLWVGAPVAGTNATITNKYAIWADGNVNVNGTLSATGNISAGGDFTVSGAGNGLYNNTVTNGLTFIYADGSARTGVVAYGSTHATKADLLELKAAANVIGTVSSTGLAVTGTLSSTDNISTADGKPLYWGGAGSDTYINGSATTNIVEVVTGGVQRGDFSSTGLTVTGVVRAKQGIYNYDAYPGTGVTPSSIDVFSGATQSGGTVVAYAGMRTVFGRISDTDYSSNLEFYTSNDNNHIKRLTIDSNGRTNVINATSGAPVVTGTNQTNLALRLSSSVTNGCIDFGLQSSTPWIQATDTSDLSQIYTLSLNPNGGAVTTGSRLTARGVIEVGFDTDPVGRMVLYPGDATRTGYTEYHSAGGVRQGYIGYATTAAADSGIIQYYAGGHNFTGAITAANTLSVTGRAFVNTATAIGGSTSGLTLFYTGVGSEFGISLKALTAGGTTAVNFFNSVGASVGSITQTDAAITFNGNATTATSATSATSASCVTSALTFSCTGNGAAAATTYNGGTARTISYNSLGAAPGVANVTCGTIIVDILTNQCSPTGGSSTASTSLGWQAGMNNTGTNTFLGYAAGKCNTTGTLNTIIGVNAGGCNTTGCGSVFIGHEAANKNSTGQCNIAIGLGAGSNICTGSDNTIVGVYAAAGVAGCGNICSTIAIGKRAAVNIGCSVGTPSSHNIVMGNYASCSAVQLLDSVVIGSEAATSNTTTNSSVIIGKHASKNKYSTNHSVIMGACAGGGAPTVTIDSGSSCTVAIGHGAGAVTCGGSNTFIGMWAGGSATSGSGNIVIGSLNEVAGYVPVFTVTTHNNYIVMGSSAAVCSLVQVAWTAVSDCRDKTNICNMPLGLSFINKLSPKSFNFKVNRNSDEIQGNRRYGFLAQDVLAAEKEVTESGIIVPEDNPDKLAINDTMIIPALVNAVNELTAKIKHLEGLILS